MILPFQTTETAARVAEKAAQMAEVDPHGFTITLVSVALVFGVLIILYIAYGISGEYFMRRRAVRQAIKAKIRSNADNKEEAAAIAMALHLYLEEDEVHDWEPGKITIKRTL